MGKGKKKELVEKKRDDVCENFIVKGKEEIEEGEELEEEAGERQEERTD